MDTHFRNMCNVDFGTKEAAQAAGETAPPNPMPSAASLRAPGSMKKQEKAKKGPPIGHLWTGRADDAKLPTMGSPGAAQCALAAVDKRAQVLRHCPSLRSSTYLVRHSARTT
jgi:hypothetical protein